MAQIPVDQRTQTINVRGINFPADCIRAAMLETGGIVVSDENLNKALDRAVKEHRATGKGEPEMLLVEKEPGLAFIPKKIRLHQAITGFTPEPIDAYLYFAVRRLYHA